MKRLIASEILRFRSRRLVVVLFGAALGGSAVGAVIAAIDSTSPTEAVRAQARAQAQQEFRNCMSSDFGTPETEVERSCRDYAGEETQDMPSHLALEEFPGSSKGFRR